MPSPMARLRPARALRHALTVVAVAALAGLPGSGASAQSAAVPDGAWSWSVIAGNMTRNRANDLLRPGEYDFADNYFAGIALAFDRPIGASRWSWGGEFQVQRHFGDQTFFEFVPSATIRYHPARPLPPLLDSLAFGLGLSHTTETPRLEIDVRGDSARTLVYWLAEAAFAAGDDGRQVFLRVHHRSDAFGLLDPDSGSNAFALGLRYPF